MSASRPACGSAPSSRPPLRLKYVEAILCVGFALAFIVWTYLSAPGPLVPCAEQHPPAIDALLPIPGKGDSDWAYSWVPVVGPIIGAVAAGLIVPHFAGLF